MKSNISTKNIREFTTGDTLFIPNKDEHNKCFFLCSFISYNEKTKSVTGKAMESTSNPSLYVRQIEEGLELTGNLEKCALYGEVPSNPGHGFYHYFNSLGHALDPMEEHKIVENQMHISKHPSFAMISASRGSGSSRTLFGSSIEHSNTISIRISTAEHNRDNNYDRIHAQKQLIEVELSATQFAEFITSLNMGDGVPCTLKSIDYKQIPSPPYITKGDIFKDEFSAQMHNLAIDMKKLVNDSLIILNNKANLTKGDREIIIKSIEKLGRELSSNIPYMSNQFKKQMTKTVLEAKNEIEAFVENKIASTGIKALNNPEVIKQLQDSINL